MYKELAEVLTDVANDAAREWLAALFREKMVALGLGEKPKLVDALVEHVLAGDGDDGFTWRDGEGGDEDDRHLQLEITDDDLAEFDKIQHRVLEVIPKVLDDTTNSAAADTFRRLKRDWPIQRASELAVRDP
jgi:hypothetical protein